MLAKVGQFILNTLPVFPEFLLPAIGFCSLDCFDRWRLVKTGNLEVVRKAQVNPEAHLPKKLLESLCGPSRCGNC